MKSVCRGAWLAIVKVHEEVNNAATAQQPKNKAGVQDRKKWRCTKKTMARLNVYGEKIKRV